MEGKGLCFTCHTVGKTGALRFPDLDGIGARAGSTDGRALATSTTSRSRSTSRTRYIVPGFNPGMPVINKPPIGLTDEEILAVIAYLQSMGGKVTRDPGVEGLAARGGAPRARPPPPDRRARRAA